MRLPGLQRPRTSAPAPTWRAIECCTASLAVSLACWCSARRSSPSVEAAMRSRRSTAPRALPCSLHAAHACVGVHALGRRVHASPDTA